MEIASTNSIYRQKDQLAGRVDIVIISNALVSCGVIWNYRYHYDTEYNTTCKTAILSLVNNWYNINVTCIA